MNRLRKHQICTALLLATISSPSLAVDDARLCDVFSRDLEYKKALPICTRAANSGEASAQLLLGYMLSTGEGVEKDLDRGILWITRAAGQGHAGAQYRLGKIYFDGEGVPKDLHLAAEWFDKAARQGHEGAQFELGLMFYKGLGVPKDLKQASYWFSK